MIASDGRPRSRPEVPLESHSAGPLSPAPPSAALGASERSAGQPRAMKRTLAQSVRPRKTPRPAAELADELHENADEDVDLVPKNVIRARASPRPAPLTRSATLALTRQRTAAASVPLETTPAEKARTVKLAQLVKQLRSLKATAVDQSRLMGAPAPARTVPGAAAAGAASARVVAGTPTVRVGRSASAKAEHQRPRNLILGQWKAVARRRSAPASPTSCPPDAVVPVTEPEEFLEASDLMPKSMDEETDSATGARKAPEASGLSPRHPEQLDQGLETCSSPLFKEDPDGRVALVIFVPPTPKSTSAAEAAEPPRGEPYGREDHDLGVNWEDTVNPLSRAWRRAASFSVPNATWYPPFLRVPPPSQPPLGPREEYGASGDWRVAPVAKSRVLPLPPAPDRPGYIQGLLDGRF